MLTICRQSRAPKGARKPVVGPVACYRGVGRTLPNLHSWRLRGGHERQTVKNPVRLVSPGAVGRDEGAFSAVGRGRRRDRRLRNLHKVGATAGRDKWGAKEWVSAGKADLSFSRRAIVGTMPRAVGRPSGTREGRGRRRTSKNE
ncbi:hypothetical protein DF057_38590 [Burkholderia cepacia]|nr:hypothetical protein DF057_38590 [Burkholderia cepacia]